MWSAFAKRDDIEKYDIDDLEPKDVATLTAKHFLSQFAKTLESRYVSIVTTGKNKPNKKKRINPLVSAAIALVLFSVSFHASDLEDFVGRSLRQDFEMFNKSNKRGSRLDIKASTYAARILYLVSAANVNRASEISTLLWRALAYAILAKGFNPLRRLVRYQQSLTNFFTMLEKKKALVKFTDAMRRVPSLPRRNKTSLDHLLSILPTLSLPVGVQRRLLWIALIAKDRVTSFQERMRSGIATVSPLVWTKTKDPSIEAFFESVGA